MRELEFKRTLADEMATVQAPPMISETEILTAGRHARQRRRAAWASAGSAAAVVVLTAAVAFTASNDNGSGPEIGASTTNPPPTNLRGGDNVVTDGPHYDMGVTLLDTLVELVPSGLVAPPDLTSVEPVAGRPLRDHYAYTHLAADPADDRWEYLANIPVTNANGIGALHIQVFSPPNEWPDAQGCTLSVGGRAPTPVAGCQEVTVAGTPIGVVTDQPVSGDGTPVPVAKWASYRHPDGTVVSLGQESGFLNSGQTWMNQLPLTDQQLAELVTDSRFNLD